MRYHLDLKHRAVIDDEINFKRVDPKNSNSDYLLVDHD